jgi:hypothetical protein
MVLALYYRRVVAVEEALRAVRLRSGIGAGIVVVGSVMTGVTETTGAGIATDGAVGLRPEVPLTICYATGCTSGKKYQIAIRMIPIISRTGAKRMTALTRSAIIPTATSTMPSPRIQEGISVTSGRSV